MSLPDLSNFDLPSFIAGALLTGVGAGFAFIRYRKSQSQMGRNNTQTDQSFAKSQGNIVGRDNISGRDTEEP